MNKKYARVQAMGGISCKGSRRFTARGDLAGLNGGVHCFMPAMRLTLQPFLFLFFTLAVNL